MNNRNDVALRKAIIRLAYKNPAMREHLLPMVTQRRPAKQRRSASLSGQSKDVEQTLKDKVGYEPLVASLTFYLEEVLKMAKRNGWEVSSLNRAIDELWN